MRERTLLHVGYWLAAALLIVVGVIIWQQNTFVTAEYELSGRWIALPTELGNGTASALVIHLGKRGAYDNEYSTYITTLRFDSNSDGKTDIWLHPDISLPAYELATDDDMDGIVDRATYFHFDDDVDAWVADVSASGEGDSVEDYDRRRGSRDPVTAYQTKYEWHLFSKADTEPCMTFTVPPIESGESARLWLEFNCPFDDPIRPGDLLAIEWDHSGRGTPYYRFEQVGRGFETSIDRDGDGTFETRLP